MIADAGLSKGGAAARGEPRTPVHLTGRHLMHDKFLVRDGRSLWTGSANFTTGGLELQDNNCLAIDSAKLSKSYAAIFEDLVTAPLKPASEALERRATVGSLLLAPYFARTPARASTSCACRCSQR